MRNLASNLLLLTAAVTLSVLLAEAATRIAYPEPAAQSFIKVGKPPPFIRYVDAMPWAGSVTRYRAEGEYETTLTINSNGLRGPDVPHEKPSGERRILYVGDSFVLAAQVDFEHTVYQQLERLLQSSGGAYEVIGAAQAGWGTDQAYQYYRYEGRRYDPDIVIYQLTTNDIADNARNTFYPGSKFRQHFDLEDGHLVELSDEPSARLGREVLVAFHRRMYLASRLYALLIDIWRSDLQVFREAQPLYEQLDIRPTLQGNQMLFVYQEPYSDRYEYAWSLTSSILSTWATEVRADGAVFAVVYVPSHWIVHDWHEVPRVYPELRREFHRWDSTKPDRYLRGITNRLNIPFLSLTLPSQTYAAEHGERLYGRNDVHWNRAGHRLGAETIHQWLLKQDWFGWQ